MLNTAPIFINCLSRGGSNIFWNIFLSHPDVCSPIYETLEIFRTDPRSPTWAGYYVALLGGQPRLFDQWLLRPRRHVPGFVQAYIDRTLYQRKLLTFSDDEMKYKYEAQPYTLDEVQAARLAAKNNNGLAFLSDPFLKMYPQAIFFGLTRDPVALYESHKRRKISRSVEQFAHYYNTLTGRMLEDSRRLPNYYMIRFEDIMQRPLESIQRVYRQAGLDFGKIQKLRFRSKPHYQSDGQYGTTYAALKHHWFDLGKVGEFLQADINALQTQQLDESEKQAVESLTLERRKALGYA